MLMLACATLPVAASVIVMLALWNSKFPLGIEMGRFLAASSGSFFTKVVDSKNSMDTNYILIDGGIHHLNYFGQKMAMEIPPIDVIHNGYKYSIDEMWNSRGSVRNNSRENPYCICGSLCTIADVIVREVSLPELNVGDVICFNRCGAYSVTEAPALFLSRELPSIYTKKGDKFTLVRDKIKASKINVKGL